ncbi:MAG TPA: hypothetical protein PL053_11625, partial [Deltaproteobacteria bacterium]|nr:hypothetical protein [Deltaproteobacteria bacterium]
PVYASAQHLDFLARRKNPHLPDRKPIVSYPEFPDGNYLWAVGSQQADLQINAHASTVQQIISATGRRRSRLKNEANSKRLTAGYKLTSITLPTRLSILLQRESKHA